MATRESIWYYWYQMTEAASTPYCGLQMAEARHAALYHVSRRLAGEPTLVAALWEDLGVAAADQLPDLTVVYCALRSSGQTFALLEFVAGQTLEELVKSSDPTSCEWEIPLFCQLLDAFEGASRPGSSRTGAQSEIELIDFGIGRAQSGTTTKLHGAILNGPGGAFTEQIFGETGGGRTRVCALLMELCGSLPGSLPRSGAFGPAGLGEFTVRSLGSDLPVRVPPPAPAAPMAQPRTRIRKLGFPLVAAAATATLMLAALYGLGGFLARRSITPNTGKLLLPAMPTMPPEIPIEIAPEPKPEPSATVTVRPSAVRKITRPPVTSIVLARGARPIRQTSLEYPAEARKERVSGTVELEVIIAEDGSVRSPRVLSGDPLLRAGLTEEISKWVYQPLRVNGKPVPMTTELAIRFNLTP
jgi:TonB family protein